MVSSKGPFLREVSAGDPAALPTPGSQCPLVLQGPDRPRQIFTCATELESWAAIAQGRKQVAQTSRNVSPQVLEV